MSRLLHAVSICAITYCNIGLCENPKLDIRDYMTQEEMRATGVSSLSKHKLEELNHWLTRFVALEAGLLKDQASVVTIASESIQTSISGQFTGWKGDTVFRLDNGQIWKQRIPGSWRTNKQNPQVTLSLNALNLWELTVIENNRKIGVKRLK